MSKINNAVELQIMKPQYFLWLAFVLIAKENDSFFSSLEAE